MIESIKVKLKSGKEATRYRYRYCYTNSQGEWKRKRSKIFDTKKEAKEAEMLFAASVTKEDSLQSSIKFDDLYAMYMRDCKANNSEPTYVTRKSKIESHILPYFTGMKISKITTITIRNWQNEMQRKKFRNKPYSKKYLLEMHTLLTAILEYGCIYYDIPKNVAKLHGNFKIKEVKDSQIKENFYTFEEFNKFIEYVNPKYKLPFQIMYFTGVRSGEMLALNWTDYNGKTIRINKSLTMKTEAGGFAIKPPKNNASYREIDLPDKLISELNEKYEQDKNKYGFNDHWFIVGGAIPLPIQTLRNNANSAMKAAGLHRITLHGFRHSHASLLINGGMNILLISKRLGHTNTTETLNTYAHMFDEQRDICVEYLNKI